MRRFLQILRTAVIIGKTRLFDPYAWQQEVVAQCERLGGVYIKFIQMLAVHESTKHWVGQASVDAAYENVPYEPIDVHAELGPSISNFTYIETEPFAAGSYGQVYKAQLNDGQDVIVKILRPSIRKTLKHDLRIMSRITGVLGWFSKASIIDIRAMTQEFARTTYGETDYMREAQNGERLRQYYEPRHTIVIPRSYPELGSKHVLVQQYVPGISLAEAMSRQRSGERIDQLVYNATGSNIWEQLTLLGIESINAVLYSDYQMVDPHPGNIRLLGNNKVALIDFGMMTGAPTNRAAFMNMMAEFIKAYEDRFEAGSFAMSMLAFYDAELYNAFQVVAKQSSQNYTDYVQKFVDSYMSNGPADALTQHYLLDRRMSQLFNLINQNNKLGIRISSENIMVQRSMNMFLSIIRAIGDLHDKKVYTTLVHTIMTQAYSGAVRQGFAQQSMPVMSEERAYEIAANWLTIVAEKDRNLYKYIIKRSSFA